MVEVRRGAERVEAEVTTLDRATGDCRPLGSSLGPQADINRHLTCEAPPSGSLLVVARHEGQRPSGPRPCRADTVVRVDLDRPATGGDPRRALSQVFADRFSHR